MAVAREVSIILIRYVSWHIGSLWDPPAPSQARSQSENKSQSEIVSKQWYSTLLLLEQAQLSVMGCDPLYIHEQHLSACCPLCCQPVFPWVHSVFMHLTIQNQRFTNISADNFKHGKSQFCLLPDAYMNSEHPQEKGKSRHAASPGRCLSTKMFGSADEPCFSRE